MKKFAHFFKSQSWTSYALTMLIFYFLICMIISPAIFIKSSLSGLSAWATSVLPSVLPFMFFTRVLSSMNCVQTITKPFSGISQKLFKTPPISFYVFFMAILSGYPVGSKMIADQFLQGKITQEDAFKMSAFCSTSGPMFIIGAVGIGMFKNASVGYVIFISHVLGAILNGLLFRNIKIKSKDSDITPAQQPQNQSKADLSEIVLNSTLSILSVGCIITIFFIVIESLAPILSFLPENIRFLTEGCIEITKGCIDLSTLENAKLATILTSFVISFGGISTVLQSLTMLAKLKMPAKLFVLQKVCHAVFSCITTILLLLFVKI